MANNRMVLICKKCNPGEWQFHSDGVFVLAKYYPSTGYYNSHDDFADSFNKFLDDHRHSKKLGYIDSIDKKEATWGPDLLFKMEYEIPNGLD